jgi:hypothetical protein
VQPSQIDCQCATHAQLALRTHRTTETAYHVVASVAGGGVEPFDMVRIPSTIRAVTRTASFLQEIFQEPSGIATQSNIFNPDVSCAFSPVSPGSWSGLRPLAHTINNHGTINIALGNMSVGKYDLDNVRYFLTVFLQDPPALFSLPSEPHLSSNEIASNLFSVSIFLSSTPPARPHVFHGRDDFVNQAVSLLKNSGVAYISALGPGGIGKTTVSLVILHHPEIWIMFRERRHFVPCDAATSTQLLVQCILQVLGVQQKGSSDPLTSLHMHLSGAGPLLLVLDN